MFLHKLACVPLVNFPNTPTHSFSSKSKPVQSQTSPNASLLPNPHSKSSACHLPKNTTSRNCTYIKEHSPVNCLLTNRIQLHFCDPKSFLAFRSTCKISRQHSEPFTFRLLKLRGHANDGTETRILGRLGDPQDHLAQCVRTLVLAPSDTDRVARLTEVVGGVWSYFEGLKVLVCVVLLSKYQ